VVQGGTMRNDAVVRAFELLTGTETARCDMPEMMGALGCALQAITFAQQERSIADLIATAHYTTKELHCHGCENSCRVCQYTFAGGNKYYSGNKCEKVFNNAGDKAQKGENIYGYKYKLLFDRPEKPDGYRADIKGQVGDKGFGDNGNSAVTEMSATTENPAHLLQGAVCAVSASPVC